MAFNFSTHLRSKEHQYLSGRLRPSGRFSFAQIFPKKRRKLNDIEYRSSEEIRLHMLRFDALHPEATKDARWRYMSTLLVANTEATRTVGLADATNSGKRAKRGSRGVSVRQRDIVCWAANQLEFAHTKSTMSFLTLTLPELSEMDLIRVQDNWSYIVNEVVREIRRRLKNAGVPTHVVGCTELQPERSKRTGLAWPHLHLVFRGKRHNKTGWALSPERYRSIWKTCVMRVLGDARYSWSASGNVQPVRESSGGYLAKYMSKGDSKSGEGVVDTWHPRDWVVISRSLRTLYERLSYTGYEVAALLLGVVGDWHSDLGWVRPIEIESKVYGRRRIGYFGWLRGEERYVSRMELFALI